MILRELEDFEVVGIGFRHDPEGEGSHADGGYEESADGELERGGRRWCA